MARPIPKTQNVNTNHEDLLQVLSSRPDHPTIKLIDSEYDGSERRRITAKEAVVLFRSGDYELVGTANRVRSIRSISKATHWPTKSGWKPCYRTTEAPSLPISLDYLNSYKDAGLSGSESLRIIPPPSKNDYDIPQCRKIFSYSIPRGEEEDPSKSEFMDQLKAKRVAERVLRS